jgi:hypothetical protein
MHLISKTAVLYKEAPFKTPEQEAAMFANPETREIAKRWRKQYGDAPGWKAYIRRRRKRRSRR